jgi:hypothetical protein
MTHVQAMFFKTPKQGWYGYSVTPPGGVATTPVPYGSSLGGGVVGTAYTGSIAATGGVPPYSFSVVTGALPAGLSMNSSGAISGTPTTPGTASFSVKATDSNGIVGTTPFSITVVAASTGASNYGYVS